jgi:8-oxo-dGTP pyrophosphatase MutT (NUDIX family)
MTVLRRASTVCVVREKAGIQVLMVRRPMTARFMPGVWVFPGGAVDDGDAAAPPSFGGNHPGSDWKVAALRELMEETGLWLTSEGTRSAPLTLDAFSEVESSDVTVDPDSLIYFSNWITPAVFPIRFDTRFFLAVAEVDAKAVVDGDELIDLDWVSPLEALDRERRGTWDVAFPTRKTLELLASEATVADLINSLSALESVPPVEPRLYVGEGEARILMPEDDGFEEAGPAQKDSTILQRLSDVVAQGGAVPAEFRSRS